MALPSPVADFPDMSQFIEGSRARSNQLMNSSMAGLAQFGQSPAVPVSPQLRDQQAQHGQNGPQGMASQMGKWSAGPSGAGDDTGSQNFRPTNETAQGIIDTAKAIGADPLDLATALSYETGGTFDPMKKGPTTQWGQHQGFIQFGEPQAQQYGADFSSPEAAMRSQLGANGAIAKYLTGNGYKPGMSGMDLYSTINAGAPGLYGRSDANNGGAPGSVADKWNSQMADHRRKAQALLGLI